MRPTFKLSKVKSLVNEDRCHITFSATETALEDYNYSSEDIFNEILSLNHSDFDKTMLSNKRPGEWMDVYKKKNIRAYIKFTIVKENSDGEEVLIISFKRTRN